MIVKFIRVTRRLHRRLTMAILGRTLLIGEDHILIVNKRISFAIVSGNDRGVGRKSRKLVFWMSASENR